jgi:hypothetical protein
MSDSGAGGDDVVRSVVLVALSVVISGALLTGCSFSGDDEAWPLVREYSIGETGPAGGIIFYDKGGRDDGWRYLEAGPVDLLESTMWNSDNVTLVGTETVIGHGEGNTNLIVDTLGGDAIWPPQQCVDYSTGRFDDWFLPSHDEIYELYLIQAGSPDSMTDLYWTSSESDAANVYIMNFSTGNLSPEDKAMVPGPRQVRPIRAF